MSKKVVALIFSFCSIICLSCCVAAYAALSQSAKVAGNLIVSDDGQAKCELSVFRGNFLSDNKSYDINGTEQIVAFPNLVGTKTKDENSMNWTTEKLVLAKTNKSKAIGFKFSFSNFSTQKIYAKINFLDSTNSAFNFPNGIGCYMGTSQTTLLRNDSQTITIPAKNGTTPSIAEFFIVVAISNLESLSTNDIDTLGKFKITTNITLSSFPPQDAVLPFIDKGFGVNGELKYLFFENRVLILGQGFVNAQIKNGEYMIYSFAKEKFLPMNLFELNYNKTENTLSAFGEKLHDMSVTFDANKNFAFIQNNDGTTQMCAFLQELSGAITLAANVKTVGNFAFSDATAITSISFSGDVTRIGHAAFRNCTLLSSVSLSPSLFAISKSMFENCTSLQNITLFDSVLLIDDFAFKGCSSLKTISIPSSTISISTSTCFAGCSAIEQFVVSESNPNYDTINGDLYDSDILTLRKHASGKPAQIFALPTNANNIAYGAFKESKNIKTLLLHEYVKKIDANAFSKDAAINIFSAASTKPVGWQLSGLQNTSIFLSPYWALNNGIPQIIKTPDRIKEGVFNNWNSYLKDDTRLFDAVIPGTNNSGMIGLGAASFQNSSILDQLKSGVRFLDLRIAEISGVLKCVNGKTNEAISDINAGTPLGTVISDINTFSSLFPKEIIIINLSNFWSSSKDNALQTLSNGLGLVKIAKKSDFANLRDVSYKNMWDKNLSFVILHADSAAATSNDFVFPREQNVLSPLEESKHNADDAALINHLPAYILSNSNSMLFELNAFKFGADAASAEKTFRVSMSTFLSSLSTAPNKNKLDRLNVISRNFYADDTIASTETALSQHQKTLSLNLFKGLIKNEYAAAFKLDLGI
ncbi:MAG: leucine-rich repeat protein [Clostridia bacterium]